MITIDQLKEDCKFYSENRDTAETREKAFLILYIIEENEKFEKEIAALKQENENLKCCGNCGEKRKEGINDYRCNAKAKKPTMDYIDDPQRSCPSWESDTLTQKERSI